VGQSGSGPRVVGRLRSKLRVRASASFQIFALTAEEGNVLSGEGNSPGEGTCPRGEMSVDRFTDL